MKPAMQTVNTVTVVQAHTEIIRNGFCYFISNSIEASLLSIHPVSWFLVNDAYR